MSGPALVKSAADSLKRACLSSLPGMLELLDEWNRPPRDRLPDEWQRLLDRMK